MSNFTRIVKTQAKFRKFHVHTCQLSRFSWESPSFSSNLPDKMDFWAFLCFSLKFSPFFQKIRTFCIHCTMTKISSSSQWWKRILIPCTSGKTSYNVLRQFVGGGGGGGGVVQNIESPDFRSLEVGTYACVRCNYLTFIFLGSHKKFSLVLLVYRWLVTSLALEKCNKECSMLYIILVQGFCPLKIKITQFPGGFRLKTCLGTNWIPRIMVQFDI